MCKVSMECCEYYVGQCVERAALNLSDQSQMHVLCVDRRRTIHRYVLCKTDKCGSVTQPCTLHRNTVCVWDYGCFYNNIFKFMIKFFVRLVTLFLINSFISSAGLYLYTRLIPKTSDMHGIDRSATAIAQILNNYTQHQH